MDYVQPPDLLNEAVKTASRKASLSVRDLLIRSFLASGLLAYATSLVFIVLSQNIVTTVGAILFPVGFVILVLLGLELATGNFAILPAGWAAGEVTLPGMFRNLGWVYLGNLAGSLFYGVLFYLAVTNCGTTRSGAIGELIKTAAQKRPSGTWPWAARLGNRLHQGNSVQLDGYAGSRAGHGFVFHLRQSRGHVAAHHDVFCARLRTLHREHVPDPDRNIVRWPGFTASVVYLESDPVTLGNLASGALLTGLALYVTNSSKKSATLEIPLGKDERALVGVGKSGESN